MRVLPQIAELDFVGAVMSLEQLGDADWVDVVRGHAHSGSGKGHRDRQADIAKPDDGELSTV